MTKIPISTLSEENDPLTLNDWDEEKELQKHNAWSRSGNATRRILSQALVESESGTRPGILEQVFTQSDSVAQVGCSD